MQDGRGLTGWWVRRRRGAFPAPSSSTGTAVNTAASQNVRIGNDHNNVRFVGLMDEIGIFNRALTAQEVQDAYRMGMP